MIRAEVGVVCHTLSEFQNTTGIIFEIIPLVFSDTEGESFLCFNAEACYPLTEENIGVALASVDDAARQNGLIP